MSELSMPSFYRDANLSPDKIRVSLWPKQIEIILETVLFPTPEGPVMETNLFIYLRSLFISQAESYRYLKHVWLIYDVEMSIYDSKIKKKFCLSFLVCLT